MVVTVVATVFTTVTLSELFAWSWFLGINSQDAIALRSTMTSSSTCRSPSGVSGSLFWSVSSRAKSQSIFCTGIFMELHI